MDNTIDYEAIEKFSKERDEAFIDFVETGDFKKFNQYCKKYNIDMPKNRKVKAAGIYKAVFYCTDIPQDIKRTKKHSKGCFFCARKMLLCVLQ